MMLGGSDGVPGTFLLFEYFFGSDREISFQCDLDQFLLPRMENLSKFRKQNKQGSKTKRRIGRSKLSWRRNLSFYQAKIDKAKGHGGLLVFGGYSSFAGTKLCCCCLIFCWSIGFWSNFNFCRNQTLLLLVHILDETYLLLFLVNCVVFGLECSSVRWKNCMSSIILVSCQM